MPELDQITSLAVVGLARSGLAAASLARRRLPAVAVAGLDAKDASGFDDELSVELERLRAAGVDLRLGPRATLSPDVDLIVKSPGVPDQASIVQEAVARGVPVWGEVEFASRFLGGHDWIAITGTNGKTTTTELTGAILRDAGRPVEVAGNVGRALAGLPDAIAPGATVVAELSSFQLEHIERFRPGVGVLLNLTEDHLDRHGTFEAYVGAKRRLFENQTGADLALLNADDPECVRITVPGRGRRGWFSLSGRDVAPAPDSVAGDHETPLVAGVSAGLLWLSVEGERRELCSTADLALRGDHNIANSLAAAAAAAAIGVPADDIVHTLRTFPGVPHRLQVVGIVGGVTWVNDSKATNVDAALKALTAYSGPVHLILGGSLKGAVYDELAAACEGRVLEVLLIGQAAAPLSEAFARRRAAVGERATPYTVLPDLEAAVATADAAATAGDVVLLSPACASFDQYRNFEHRGEHFTELVHTLRE